MTKEILISKQNKNNPDSEELEEKILTVLDEFGICSISDLALILNEHRITVWRKIRRLEKFGDVFLVTKKENFYYARRHKNDKLGRKPTLKIRNTFNCFTGQNVIPSWVKQSKRITKSFHGDKSVREDRYNPTKDNKKAKTYMECLARTVHTRNSE